MKIKYQGNQYMVTGETAIFYIAKLEEGNEQTIYIPKDEVIEVVKKVI